MQHLFLISVLLAIASITVTVFKLGTDKATTISLHATKQTVAFIGLGLGLTVSVILNAIFLFGWLQDNKQLSSITTGIYSLLLVLILATSWIPDTSGWKRLVHRSAAYGIVLIIPLLLLSLFLAPIQPLLVKAMILFAVVAQGYMLYLLFKVESAKNSFLTYQGVYLLLFFTSLGFFIYH